MTITVTRLRGILYGAGLMFLLGLVLVAGHSHAVANNTNSEFSLQVSPSPLVTTMKPGTTTALDLRIRNDGTSAEDLKIEPRSFSVSPTTGNVSIGDSSPPGIASWISFSSPRFHVEPGQSYEQKITIALPKQTGFSYSFALVISRQSEKPVANGRLIKGSIGVFTLVNVDRPGATRQLAVNQFSSSKHIYEYLPTSLEIHLKNTGNSIVQPYGNVFINRGGAQLATMPVNDQRGYILPGTTRILSDTWSDGFPHYVPNQNKAGRHLVWNWTDLSKLRIGKYTAKLVAVYNDGGRDVPLEGEVSFWVIPWRLLLGALVVVVLVGLGLWSFVKKLVNVGKRARRKTSKHSDKNDDQ